jgi:hypothetical protein
VNNTLDLQLTSKRPPEYQYSEQFMKKIALLIVSASIVGATSVAQWVTATRNPPGDFSQRDTIQIQETRDHLPLKPGHMRSSTT